MAKKRGSGEGSIYKDKEGRWRGSVHLGYRLGKRVRKLLSGRTRAEVVRKVRQVLQSQELGLTLGPERQTVADYLERWLEDVAKPGVRPKTYRTYLDITRQHLIPSLGKRKLVKLAPQDVRRFMGEKLADGLSPKTVKHLRDTLRCALNVAVKDGLLTRNAAALAEAPRAERKEMLSFTPDEARCFLEDVAGHRLEALFSVTLALGLRQGEILGLRWIDIDLENGRLTVRLQLQRNDGKLQLVEPKTAKSARVLMLPQVAVSALAAHKLRQEEERALAGSRWVETGMVFTTGIGTMLDQRSLLRQFYKILETSELPRIRFHDLRHSAATLLLAQGVHPRLVMDLLGHSSIVVTLDTYSHVIPVWVAKTSSSIRINNLRREADGSATCYASGLRMPVQFSPGPPSGLKAEGWASGRARLSP